MRVAPPIVSLRPRMEERQEEEEEEEKEEEEEERGREGETEEAEENAFWEFAERPGSFLVYA
eukprot:4338015-Pyramimonas_sp.AAC.1